MAKQISFRRGTKLSDPTSNNSFRFRTLLIVGALVQALGISPIDSAQASTHSEVNTPWQVTGLPAVLGQVGAIPDTNHVDWQPMNLGLSASTFAPGRSGEEYMSNSAGIWQWSSHHWNYVSGTMDLGLASNGYANSPMTVTAKGDLIVAAANRILEFNHGKSVVISDGHETNIAFLTWMPNGTLVAGLNVYPVLKNTSSYAGLGGPAPMPSLKLMGYSNHRWSPISMDLPKALRGVSAAAWSPGTNQLALAMNTSQVMVMSPHGWKSLWIPTTASPMEAVTSVAWVGSTLLAGTTDGIWQYHHYRWTRVSVNGMSQRAEVHQLTFSGNGGLAVTQNPDNSTSVFRYLDGVWRKQPLSMTEVSFIGQSPTGVPVLETQNQANLRRLYQYVRGVWQPIAMNGFPSETYLGNMPQPFYWPSSLGWSPTGTLTIASLYNGVWQRTKRGWQNVGGPVVRSGPYISGSIGWLPNGELVDIIRRDVPPLPKTPSLEEDSVMVLRHGHWNLVAAPPDVRPNLFRLFTMGPHGEVVMREDKGNTVNLWVWQGGHWKEFADVTASFGSAQIGGVGFDSKGHLVLDIAGLAKGNQNGVYQWAGHNWVQTLKDTTPLQSKNTYWFHDIQLPGQRRVFSVMNQTGYHLWENQNGHWTNLGLDGQDVVEMGLLTGNRLYAITQEGVCWIRTLI